MTTPGDTDLEGSELRDEGDTIGSGQPPKQHRFRKGQSGNPKGRPRKPVTPAPVVAHGLTEQQRLAREVAMMPVTVRDGEGTRSIPTYQAVLMAEAQGASRGNRFHKRDFLSRQAEAEAAELAERKADYDDWSMIKTHLQTVADLQAAKGNTAPSYELHADDIILRANYVTDVIGPLTNADSTILKQQVQLRDYFIVQNAYDHLSLRLVMRRPAYADHVLFSDLMLISVNGALLPRFRLDSAALYRTSMDHLCSSIGTVETRLRQAKAALGDPGGKIGPYPLLRKVDVERAIRSATAALRKANC